MHNRSVGTLHKEAKAGRRVRNVTGPTFFVGMPRSGTTMMFEGFVEGCHAAWPSNFTERWPGVPILNIWRRVLDNPLIRMTGEKGEGGSGRYLNRFRVRPSEAYAFWDRVCGTDFARSYLRDEVPAPATTVAIHTAMREIVRWQGKRHFTAKFTGPGRVRFLSAAFPDARFVHVVRDGRAVVSSLLKVGFWANKGGLENPFWSGGFSAADIERLRAERHFAASLAALQWKQVVTGTDEELAGIAPERQLEVRYEDFVEAPTETIESLVRFSGFPRRERVSSRPAREKNYKNMNYKFRSNLSPECIDRIEGLMQPLLGTKGYR